jgi:hypothetical protein
MFQNGFGAYGHATYICTYDIAGKNVTNIQVAPN